MDRDIARSTSSAPQPGWRGQLLGWALLLWGLVTFALRAPLQGEELLMAAGAEWIVLGLLDLLWAGQLVALWRGLALLTVMMPLLAISTVPLFYYSGFSASAVGETAALGVVAMVPMGGLTLIARSVSRNAPTYNEDPRWLRGARWVMRAALALIVVAFDIGDWDSGAVIVTIGAVLALLSLMIILPYRASASVSGRGKLLAYLGGAVVLVILGMMPLLGGRMSAEEAAVGIVPAVLIALVGLAVSLGRR